MPRLVLGNCLLGALVLMVRLRTTRVRLRRRRGKIVGHFHVVARDGTRWHFKCHEDVFEAWPAYYFLFRGRLEKMG